MWAILTFLGEAAVTAVARRRAAAALDALNDRHLADIGLDRCDIDVFVRRNWPWPGLPAGQRPLHRPSLQGCG